MRKLNLFLAFLCLLLLTTACESPNNSTSYKLSSPNASNNTHSPTIGSFREYALPQTGSGAMRPAIDSKGRLWFGEMSHNFLAMFDPHTQTFTQITPPHGAYSIMGVVVAKDDTIWFAEQDANYIGHYIPTTRQFQTYSLPTVQTVDPNDAKKMLSLPSGPNDLAFDTHGNLWFTEMNADSLGMLNTRTGAISQYPLSKKKSVQTISPYGVTVDAHAVVWFTETTKNAIGRLDPTTGTIQLFTLKGTDVPLMEIASDTHGIVWATSFNGNMLVRLDPKTGMFKTYTAPSTSQGSGGLYGLLIASDAELWVTVPSENAIARFDSNTHHFIYSTIPTTSSFPFGLVMDTQHNIWFTEAGSDKLGVLHT